MRFWEALKALEEGKSVRIKEWPTTAYWSFKQTGQLWTSIVDLFVLASQEWELYQEPKQQLTFAQVVEGLKQGKKFRRKGWIGEPRLWIELENEFHENCRIFECGLKSNPYKFTMFDFEATDWIEVQ
jgi:hypothetical protein